VKERKAASSGGDASTFWLGRGGLQVHLKVFTALVAGGRCSLSCRGLHGGSASARGCATSGHSRYGLAGRGASTKGIQMLPRWGSAVAFFSLLALFDRIYLALEIAWLRDCR
jgi:hypothetical protein